MRANEELMKQVLKEGIDENEMRFGQVGKAFGYGRFEVKLSDGRTTNASIRDLLASKRGTPVSLGSIVLVHLPNWEKDALTKNAKPIAYIEGILDNDSHVPVLRSRGELPEWIFSKSGGGGGSAEPEMASFEFVSEEAERAVREDGEEKEGEDEEEEAPSNSAAASRKLAGKARDVKIEKARTAKMSGTAGPINIDDI
jgi:translation initiation factor IF-1